MGATMKPSKFATQSLLLAGTVFLAPVAIQAQTTPGPGGSIVGQPPGQGMSPGGGYIIGQPPPSPPMPPKPSMRQNDSPPPLAPNQIGPVQSGPPPSGLMNGRDPMKERLNRANREGADVDRNGIISPEEATTIPQSSP
ncbi:hypothetical protein Nmul_A2148 [Nitrosospira multiformis ATCC 25196]|uniref:EF-hand domain-containing protein n=2 Tax=Nitrosospira multiformis (strain ATCC 25196 / NCIMB 11849 / C 71) TaxID=323848 RepID=Q2Y730_NITMU|nr:hypothetical protein Nmul_A2148 [Nitrosospira multiformis ATCC 25196]